MKKQTLTTLFLLTLLASCTVQKRYFNSGFHVTWHIGGKSQGEEKTVNKKEKVQVIELETQELITLETVSEENQPNIDITTVYSPFFQESKIVNRNTTTESFVRESESDKSEIEIQNSEIKQDIEDKNESNDDSYLYLLFMAMAASSIGLQRGFRKKLTTLTRWANANPKKTQIAITGMQLSIAGLGLFSGYNLGKMGFDFSDNAAYLMAGISLAGFIATPFLPKKNRVNIPKKIFRNKIGYLSIALSSFMILNFAGNKMAQSHDKTLISKSVESFDQFLFGEDNTNNEMSNTLYSKRTAAEAGVVIAAVLLIILLLVTLCAGICIALLSTSVEFIGLGLLLAGLSIFGIIEVIKWVSDSSDKNSTKPQG